MTEKTMTGPELYTKGVEHFQTAEMAAEETILPSHFDDMPAYREAVRQRAAVVNATATLAAAAFAGAQAAAWGTIVIDEVRSDDLAAAWRKATGDTDAS